MNNRMTGSLGIGGCIGIGVIVGVIGIGVGVGSVVGGIGGVGIGVGCIVGTLGVIAVSEFVLDFVRELWRGRQAPTGLRAVRPLVPRSLRWLRWLLPRGEGAAWLAEVVSCLAEAGEPGQRRRYVRSYRRAVPQLVCVSWAEYLSGSRHRELL